ncbi:hypothetical protein ASPBRDRAFT_47553 [Aspergillus brasiliensis CBS 101740]|uniref:Heterokaryon incompatibility domain-containing protein n=1 Tax=Aspergillus brasiliensis (strain CBS 101740 / IMI 381727 / IBT 21946) TaxID=767769 RepID=A0A1L9U8M0_ASPBC|nr:hypothetical protein ASPBRDRAFT_47553 [Aspergillus brasiliensis CBS 101740]
MPGLYNPLNPNRREIRLLEIPPSESEDGPIQGSLRVVSLDDSPKFEALSYAWGDITELTDVTISGCTLGVSENLALFLLRLRQTRETRVVWVDFICINQADVSEKSTQVPLMADIYRCATSVIAWLGDLSNPDIEEAVAYNDASEGRLTPRSKYWLDLGDPSTLTERQSQARERAMISVYFGGLELLDASYWKRLWTFQEWHLPSKEPLCMCGKLTFQLGNMFMHCRTAFKFMRSRVQDMMGVNGKVGNDKSDDQKVQHRKRTFLTTILEHCHSWSSDWEAAHQHVPPELIRPDIFRSDGLECRPFSTLLILTSGRQCTQPLDRVYALYGLAPHVQQWLPPDYTKSMDQVTLETTAYMINHDSVAFAFKDFDFGQTKALPSWALKLYDTEVPHSLSLTYNPFRDSKLKKTIYIEAYVSDLLLAHWVLSNLSTLHLRGRPIGRVFGASQLPSNSVDILHALSEIQEHVLGLQREKGDLSGRFLHDILYNCTGDYLKEVPILVLEFVDLMMSQRAEDRHKLYANISNEMKKQVDQYDVLAGKWAIGIDSGIGLRTIGVAKSTDVQDGDLLIVPYGISQVLVIRDCPGEYQNKACQKIMGRAYVAGIGEDPEYQLTPLIEELEKVPFEQFYLR